MRSKINAQPNQSLIDGIATLQALAVAKEPVGCRELARQLGFDPTRTNRILRTLAYLGIARQTATRKYAPGAGMHVLAAQSLFASGLIRRSLPVLEGLRQFGHTVAMGVLWRDNVSYLFHAPPGVSAAEALGRVGLYPADRGGIGVALLATLDDDEIVEIYETRGTKFLARELPELMAAIERTRADGFARVRVPDDRDYHTIAVSVGTPPHSAIGLSGWIPESATADLVARLRVAADAIVNSADSSVDHPLLSGPLPRFRFGI
jgi:DNA-binding IclR family transcriptional regulator